MTATAFKLEARLLNANPHQCEADGVHSGQDGPDYTGQRCEQEVATEWRKQASIESKWFCTHLSVGYRLIGL